MEVSSENILHMLLRRKSTKKKREKTTQDNAKNKSKENVDSAEITTPATDGPIKILVSQTKSMTDREFETKVREHRRKMSKKYLTKQVSVLIYIYND